VRSSDGEVKVSQWLREYQISGQVPEANEPALLAFWAGWLIGAARHGTVRTLDEARELAIKVAEFIEEQK
jgi:hypothetical protein